MKQTSVRERWKFDETFKREAVQNWLNSAKSAEVVGEELGITASLLYSWRNLVPAAAGGRAGVAFQVFLFRTCFFGSAKAGL